MDNEIKIKQVQNKLDNVEPICRKCRHFDSPMCLISYKFHADYMVWGEKKLMRAGEMRIKQKLCGFEGKYFEPRD